jgi:hypothetical protein
VAGGRETHRSDFSIAPQKGSSTNDIASTIFTAPYLLTGPIVGIEVDFGGEQSSAMDPWSSTRPSSKDTVLKGNRLSRCKKPCNIRPRMPSQCSALGGQLERRKDYSNLLFLQLERQA